MKQGSRAIGLLKVAVGVAAVSILIATGRLSPQNLRAVGLTAVVLTVAPLLLINLLGQALRWWCLLRAHRIELPLVRCLEFASIGNFFSMILPGAVGGEMARVYYLWQREPARRFAVTLSVFVDRGLGLFSLFLLAGIAFLGWGGPAAIHSLGIASLVFVALTSMAVIAVLLPVSRQSISAFLPARWAEAAARETLFYRQGAGWILLALLFSLAAAIAIMAAYWQAAAALGSPLGLWATITTVPFIVAANSLPISPGGLGVGESVASGILAANGYALGAELALLVRLVLTVLRMVGLIPFLVRRGSAKRDEPC